MFKKKTSLRMGVIAVALAGVLGVAAVPEAASANPSGCVATFNTWTHWGSGSCVAGYGYARQVVRCTDIWGHSTLFYGARVYLTATFRQVMIDVPSCTPPNSASTWVQVG